MISQGKRESRQYESCKTKETSPFNNGRQDHIINGVQILYTNADGLINKRHDLQLLINSSLIRQDIIVITEISPKQKSKRNYVRK